MMKVSNQLFKNCAILILFLVQALLVSCSTIDVPSPRYQGEDLRLFAIEKFRRTVYVHLETKNEVRTGTGIETGQILGEVTPKPTILSTKYHNMILQSQQLYKRGQYESAAQILKTPYKEEPRNLFILESYARALYWFDKAASFAVYQELIEISDEMVGDQDRAVILDLWFPEAYWKIATLHLDQENYAQAAFEICRALLTIYSLGEYEPFPGDTFYIQVFEYLTETHFRLNQFSYARYYAQKTLELDPTNEYVKEILTLTSS